MVDDILSTFYLNTTLINGGSKDELKASGYCRNLFKTCIFHILAILCGGFPYILIYWHKVFGIKWQYVKCALDRAEVLILKDIHGQTYVAPIQQEKVGPSFPPEYAISHSAIRCSNNGNFDEKSPLCGQTAPFMKCFVHQHIKYLWNVKHHRFEMLTGIECGICLSQFHEFTGYTSLTQENRLELYGYNIMNVNVKSYWRLFIDEVLNPFYLFEIFSVVVWIIDEYIYYASCILVISVVSVGVALFEIRQQSEALRNMAENHSSTMVTVCRSKDVYESISSHRLVPGDIVSIPPTGCIMSCDAVLTVGTCIVDESALTGECVPELKTAVPDLNEPYCPDIHKRHTLFCGTQILQTRYYGQEKVLAVVIRTGFTTAKGELVRSILYPKPIGFKFYIDSIKFVFLLFLIALCGIGYCVYVYITKGAPVEEIIIRACDMLTIVVPPAMPTAMTVGTVYAQGRLRKKGIFCISPPRINVSGKLKLMCFDKTGTLTEGGLEFCGVVPCQDGTFGDIIRDPPSSLTHKDPVLVSLASCHALTKIDGKIIGDPLEIKMFESTRWVLEEQGTGPTRYDVMAPVIIKPITRDTFLSMHGIDFVETGFEMPYEVGIVRQFPFSSSLQRMSVVVRALGSPNMELYCKGSPEKVCSLCVKRTVPESFSDVLRSYTIRGFRVLALAYRILDRRLTWHQMHRMKRDQMESNLHFLGLLIMHNTLKPETTRVIYKLGKANIRCVMVTGDNLLTAVNVARNCNMLPFNEKIVLVTATPPTAITHASVKFVAADLYDAVDKPLDQSLLTSSTESVPLFTESWPESILSPLHNVNRLWRRHHIIDINELLPKQRRIHFALSGKTLNVIRQHYPDLLPRILIRGTVFARMAPDQKTQVIEELQDLGYVVGMCGDGANDCGALKAAHVGISLSEAEASVAAPFTSKVGDISCVPTIIQEGRCALVTSFGVFKYMALYSLIQFISVLILYSFRTTLGDFMFLYHDLVITTTVAVLMGKTAPYPDLVVRRPKGSLLSSSNLLSLTMQVALTAAIQLGSLLILMLQPWYQPIHPVGDEVIIPCWEVTVIFYISSYQYLILALAFSYGPPYRQPFYTNGSFLLALVLLCGFTLVLNFVPVRPLADFFELIGVQFDDPLTDYSADNNFYMLRGYLLILVALNMGVSLLIEYLTTESNTLSEKNCQFFNNKSVKNKYKRIEKDLETDKEWPPLSDAVLNDPLAW